MTSTHRHHPDPAHDPDVAWDTPILYDDCERCREHAVSPWASLDERHLKRLREVNLGLITPLTRLERLAANALREYDARVLLETVDVVADVNALAEAFDETYDASRRFFGGRAG